MSDVYSWIALAIAGLAFVLGLQVLGITGLFVVIVLVLAALTLAGYVAGQRVRRSHARRDPRFQPTQEVFHDPRTGETMQVYVDEKTGERRYWKAQ
jgi:hypothetical protein